MAKAFRELIGVQPSTVSTDDSVLVIIDAQNEYISGQLKTENVSSTRAAIESLLKKYRSASAPLIHVVHQTPDGAPVFTPSTDLAKIFPELTPTDSETTITKNYPGSFTGTELEAAIKKTGRNKIVLVGYMAHVCVSTTARQGAEKGFDVVIVREAVGDRDIPGVKAEELVKVTLAELADAFGTVVGIDEVK